jgi:putative DNA primase/helicase
MAKSIRLSASRVAQAITQTDQFAQDATGELYVFRSGHYQPGGEQHIKRVVKQLAVLWKRQEEWKSKLALETCEYVRADARELWLSPPADVVNFENGLLNVVTRELRPHSPDHLSPVQLPVKYDPAAAGEVWSRFAERTFPLGAHELVGEIPAWTMTPNTSIQKAAALTGEGSNGKSAFLAGLSAFLGRRNICAVSLHQLEMDRFAASRLAGRLANICPDLPSQKLVSTAMFKALTGGDLIQGERKYRDVFEFRPYAKLIFSANLLPSSDDATNAFYRRWIVVPFDRTFEPGDPAIVPRTELDAMLAAPDALSGLLNLALDALPRLRSHGFTSSASMEAALQEFRSASDSFVAFLDRNVVDDPKKTIVKRDLIDRYNDVCSAAKRPLMTNTAIGRALRRARPSIRDCQIVEAGKKVDAYRGICWNPAAI